MFDKLPPQNIQMEESIISAALLDREVAEEICELIFPEEFYRPAHQKIFAAIKDQVEKGGPVDAPLIAEVLMGRKQLEEIGGAVYLAKLLDEAPVPPNAKYYCGVIREKAHFRRIISVSNKIMQQCYSANGHNSREIIDEIQREVLELDPECSRGGYARASDLLNDRLDHYAYLSENKGRLTGIPSFFPDLDRITCGFQDADLIILAARPSMGKTALALNFLVGMALRSIPSAIFSFEMSREQLLDRMTASLSGVNLLKFRSGYFEDGDWEKIMNDAFDRLHSAEIFIDDTAESDISAVRRRARRLKKAGARIILLDYLQLLGVRGETNPYRAVSVISRQLKLMAKELSVPVIALSQLSRKLEDRPEKRPRLSDLRESGALEQDADVVMFLYRDEVYNPTTKDRGQAELNVAKHRNGPLGTIKLK